MIKQHDLFLPNHALYVIMLSHFWVIKRNQSTFTETTRYLQPIHKTQYKRHEKLPEVIQGTVPIITPM